MVVPPTIIDDGDGTWLESLQFLPWLVGPDGSYFNRAYRNQSRDNAGAEVANGPCLTRAPVGKGAGQ